MRKMVKRGLIILTLFIILVAIIIAVMFIKQAIIDSKINDDISSIYTSDEYKMPVSVNGIEVIKQNISCGYACIELLARWQGKDITEDSLLAQDDNEITTSMGNGFVNEMNRQFPEFHTAKYANLTNSELLSVVYKSLEKGMPVPFEFAALYTDGEESVWTLHFAIITAMDVNANEITVSNPYGYVETYSINEFLRATRYDSYENMESLFKLGFISGIFRKNTVYLIENIK